MPPKHYHFKKIRYPIDWEDLKRAAWKARDRSYQKEIFNKQVTLEYGLRLAWEKFEQWDSWLQRYTLDEMEYAGKIKNLVEGGSLAVLSISE